MTNEVILVKNEDKIKKRNKYTSKRLSHIPLDFSEPTIACIVEH